MLSQQAACANGHHDMQVSTDEGVRPQIGHDSSPIWERWVLPSAALGLLHLEDARMGLVGCLGERE